MSGSASFVSQIVASAKDRGVALSPEDIESINENLGFITTVEDGAIRFTAGPFVDLGEAIEGMSRGYGKPIEQPVTATQPVGLGIPANANRTQQAVAKNAELRSKTKVGIYKRDQAQELVREFGNPWRTNNKTHQAIVMNTASDLVSGLKSEAGIR